MVQIFLVISMECHWGRPTMAMRYLVRDLLLAIPDGILAVKVGRGILMNSVLQKASLGTPQTLHHPLNLFRCDEARQVYQFLGIFNDSY